MVAEKPNDGGGGGYLFQWNFSHHLVYIKERVHISMVLKKLRINIGGQYPTLHRIWDQTTHEFSIVHVR